MAQRALEAPARQSVPDAGRFPARLAAADLLAALHPARRLSLHRRAGPDGAARGLAGLRPDRPGTWRSASGGPGAAAAIRRRADGDVELNRRRAALRLHPPAGQPRHKPRTVAPTP